jgi:phosphopantothenoylcysteine synthetase/decarboxylase
MSDDALGAILLATEAPVFVAPAMEHHMWWHAATQNNIKQLEERQAEGYARHPVEPGEFDVWESEQVWGET